jgi:hypothetical protein
MDTLDWVIIVVGAFIGLVIAVGAYEAEKRLEKIISCWSSGRSEAVTPWLEPLAARRPHRTPALEITV